MAASPYLFCDLLLDTYRIPTRFTSNQIIYATKLYQLSPSHHPTSLLTLLTITHSAYYHSTFISLPTHQHSTIYLTLLAHSHLIIYNTYMGNEIVFVDELAPGEKLPLHPPDNKGAITLVLKRDAIWERGQNEPIRPWLAFQFYRNLDPLDRIDLHAAYDAYFQHQNAKGQTLNCLTYSQYITCYRQYFWIERVAAWDAFVDTQSCQALVASQSQARVEAANIGKALRNKAAEALSVTAAIIEDAEGEAQPALAPQIIMQLAKLGIELERQALGIADAGDSKPPVPGGVYIQNNFTPEQAREIIEAQTAIIATTRQLMDE